MNTTTIEILEGLLAARSKSWIGGRALFQRFYRTGLETDEALDTAGLREKANGLRFGLRFDRVFALTSTAAG